MRYTVAHFRAQMSFTQIHPNCLGGNNKLQLMEELEKPNYSEMTLMEMSKQLGALHYRLKVWFQAENWLCVKKSVVQAVLSTDKRYKGYTKFC